MTVTVVTALAWRISHPTNVKASSSALMLPWPAGVKHNIFGGYSYGQGDHTSIYYYAIDWNMVNAPVTAVLDGAAYTGHDTCGGYYVWIVHAGGLGSYYGHLDSENSGVVIQEVEDLDWRAVGQLPGGGIHLPGLVGQLGLETDE